jgi:hypothetical protein
VRIRNAIVGGMVLTTLTAAAGCSGGTSKPASAPVSTIQGPALTVRIAAALDQVRSAHLHGTFVAGGAPGESGTASTMDFVVTQDASSGTLMTAKNHSTTSMIEIDSRIYTKTVAGTENPEQANRWVYSPASSTSTSSGGGMSVEASSTPSGSAQPLHKMAESLRVPGPFDSSILDAVGHAEMHQHDCYVLARRDGSRLFVDSRTFLPVRFATATTAIDGASDLAMDAYNAPVSIVAPVGAVNMASLFH